MFHDYLIGAGAGTLRQGQAHALVPNNEIIYPFFTCNGFTVEV